MMISNAVIDAPFRAHNPVACSQPDATITGIAPLPSSYTVQSQQRACNNVQLEEGGGGGEGDRDWVIQRA